ncbi:hypothetical protein G7B40_023885 [Aetokthonos hydrillicola Thurmond2011]|uniref:Uncharacterized protein n=1 Tax=Aetokthonos hydrillicola Thurmond2011 TaxID=2712845 RepID=A0AAP5IAC7_9CYAN|nr:hypothetical protein [Aetokthonos hydrillicola CCALA 1050]MBW4586941.1 hypothetical protein [Aetokthonos hydrillicola CCALA 1050]MDR9897584.1 hypothetical protein [Aetokthonos hydrillicola Thurmond2011]
MNERIPPCGTRFPRLKASGVEHLAKIVGVVRMRKEGNHRISANVACLYKFFIDKYGSVKA